ncbi:MAG: cobalamin B12-binding domain-containing protein, partial [Planctomycetota bacterium]
MCSGKKVSGLAELREAVARGDVDRTKSLIEKLLSRDIPTRAILEDGVMVGMTWVTSKFKRGEIYIPEVLVASQAFSAGMETLRAVVGAGRKERLGRVLLATVYGELHDLGMRVVGLFLEAANFEVVNLGRDWPIYPLVSKVRGHLCESESGQVVLGLSSSMWSTVEIVRLVIGEITAQGLRDQVKIIVGGSVLSGAWADSTGADTFGENAYDAVCQVRRL